MKFDELPNYELLADLFKQTPNKEGIRLNEGLLALRRAKIQMIKSLKGKSLNKKLK